MESVETRGVRRCGRAITRRSGNFCFTPFYTAQLRAARDFFFVPPLDGGGGADGDPHTLERSESVGVIALTT